jgi:hypothetical protein
VSLFASTLSPPEYRTPKEHLLFGRETSNLQRGLKEIRHPSAVRPDLFEARLASVLDNAVDAILLVEDIRRRPVVPVSPVQNQTNNNAAWD